MATSSPRKVFDPYNLSTLCFILGLTSLAIFLLNIMAIALPPEIRSVQWRTSFLDQLSNRSFGLLFGMGFTMYGLLSAKAILRKVAVLCLMAGIVFIMSSFLIIHDGLVLRDQAIENIASQANQLQNQLEETRNNPDSEQSLSFLQLQEANQQIARNQKELVENAKADITKATIVSTGNFVLVGLGLLSLSRFGLMGSR